eukprot:5864028-Amphidinium_carterae.2
MGRGRWPTGWNFQKRKGIRQGRKGQGQEDPLGVGPGRRSGSASLEATTASRTSSTRTNATSRCPSTTSQRRILKRREPILMQSVKKLSGII